jgi:twitching motility two-component system response regulator PilH
MSLGQTDEVSMAYTVLLIDYDPRSIGRIRTLILRFGARVILARCGTSGLEKYRRTRPDLTLVQDLIPNLHGFDVCRQIKDSDGGADHPVVVLCACHNHSALIDTGCDAYLKKPYDDDELLEVLQHLLPRCPAPPEPDNLSPAPVRPTREEVPAPRATHPPVPESVEAEIVDRLDVVFGFFDDSATTGASAPNTPGPHRAAHAGRREATWERK